MVKSCKGYLGTRQQGAVAIEFAALFLVFFTILYAVIAYSIPLLLIMTFKELSASATRYAVRVAETEESVYMAFLDREVSRLVEDSWLPASWVSGGCPAPDPVAGEQWQPLPSGYGHLAREPERNGHLLHVCLQRYYNASGSGDKAAIIPVLRLFDWQIPTLPKDPVTGDTVLRAHTITRL